MHRLKKLLKVLKWQRRIRAAVSTQLALLENPSLFALGGLTDEEGFRVIELLHDAAGFSGPIVEFGTLFGLTTRLIAENGNGQPVITVDNFCWNPFGLTPALHESFTRRVLVGELASKRVSLYMGDSASFRATYTGEVPALVFLDADHSYEAVRDEIAWAKGLGVPLISGHDYKNLRFGVTRAVDEAFPDGVQVRGSVWSSRQGEGDPNRTSFPAVSCLPVS